MSFGSCGRIVLGFRFGIPVRGLVGFMSCRRFVKLRDVDEDHELGLGWGAEGYPALPSEAGSEGEG